MNLNKASNSKLLNKRQSIKPIAAAVVVSSSVASNERIEYARLSNPFVAESSHNVQDELNLFDQIGRLDDNYLRFNDTIRLAAGGGFGGGLPSATKTTKTTLTRNDDAADEADDDKIEIEINATKNFDYDIQEWKSLISSLTKERAHLGEYARAKRRSDFKSIEQLRDYLAKAPAKTDAEKIWTIFVWIAENIDYNSQGYFSNNYGDNTANGVFSSGKAVCAGYANLFVHLCTAMWSIKSHKVSGKSKGLGYKIGQPQTLLTHAWIVVKCDNKWQLIEITWAAGYTKNSDKQFHKKFEPFWFFTPPSILIHDHYPKSSTLQLLSKPLNANEFMNIPKHDLEFYKLDIECTSHQSAILMIQSNPFRMEFKAPGDIQMIANLFDENKDSVKLENCVLMQRKLKQEASDEDSSFLNEYELSVVVPNKSRCYLLRIYAAEIPDLSKQQHPDQQQHQHQLLQLDGITKYLINPSQLKQQQQQQQSPIRYVKFFDIGHNQPFYLFSPIECNLKVNKSYDFKVYVRDAAQVGLIMEKKPTLIQLVATGATSTTVNNESKKTNKNLWTLKQTFSEVDKLKLIVRFDLNQPFKCICIYNLIK